MMEPGDEFWRSDDCGASCAAEDASLEARDETQGPDTDIDAAEALRLSAEEVEA